MQLKEDSWREIRKCAHENKELELELELRPSSLKFYIHRLLICTQAWKKILCKMNKQDSRHSFSQGYKPFWALQVFNEHGGLQGPLGSWKITIRLLVWGSKAKKFWRLFSDLQFSHSQTYIKRLPQASFLSKCKKKIKPAGNTALTLNWRGEPSDCHSSP